MHRALPCFALLFVTAPVVAQERAAGAGSEVVVTARPLLDTEKALTACLARQCPPKEDIAATLAHAENLFIAGQFQQARTTLTKSLDRNRRFAHDYPIETAGLARASSRMAAHLGYDEAQRSGAFQILELMRKGLPTDDPHVLGARVEIADMFITQGRLDDAMAIYHAVANRAAAVHEPIVRGYVLLRMAVIYAQLSEHHGEYADSYRRAAAALTDMSDPSLAPFAMAGRLIIAERKKDTAAIDAVIRDYARSQTATKVTLLYAPHIRLFDENNPGLGESLASREPQWIDVGFWIDAAGQTTNVHVLREGPGIDHRWLPPVLKAIEGRRYAPMPLDPRSPGVLRVERYTLAPHLAVQIRSRIPEAQAPRLQTLDLSVDPPPELASATPQS